MTDESVNSGGEGSPRKWKIDREELGEVLRKATDAASLKGVDVAEKLGMKKSNTISRWWLGEVGISDQLNYFVNLARESEEARAILYEYMGGEVRKALTSDLEELLNDAEKLRGVEAVEAQIESLRSLVLMLRGESRRPEIGSEAPAAST